MFVFQVRVLILTCCIMIVRIFERAKFYYVQSRGVVETAQKVIDDNRTLFWLAGTVSSGLGAWSVFTLRRMHYAKIENKIETIEKKLSDQQMLEDMLEHTRANNQKMLEDLLEDARANKRLSEKSSEKSNEKSSEKSSTISLISLMATVALSAFLAGYLGGRATSSYQMYKRNMLLDVVKQRRIYIACIPEEVFEADNVAKELELSLIDARLAQRRSDTAK